MFLSMLKNASYLCEANDNLLNISLEMIWNMIISEVDFGMSSITVGEILASFALAKIIVFFCCGKLERSEFAACMRAITEWLVLG